MTGGPTLLNGITLSAVNPLLGVHVIAPVLLIEQSPLMTTGLKFVPSATNTAPDVFVVIYKSSPLTVKSPLSVVLFAVMLFAVTFPCWATVKFGALIVVTSVS